VNAVEADCFSGIIAKTAFYARILWWDSRNVYIQCPFCTKTHGYVFGKSHESIGSQVHCYSRSQLGYPEYQFKYSFSKVRSTTPYEIDNAGRIYIAVEAEPPQPPPDTLVNNIACLPLNKRSATTQES
jgi:hypothetical protein